MAAVAATGTTVIRNAASEPHVQDLCHFLVALGAEIDGIGTNKLTINGGRKLGGATHRVGPDHIEVGSFIGLAAVTSSAVAFGTVAISSPVAGFVTAKVPPSLPTASPPISIRYSCGAVVATPSSSSGSARRAREAGNGPPDREHTTGRATRFGLEAQLGTFASSSTSFEQNAGRSSGLIPPHPRATTTRPPHSLTASLRICVLRSAPNGIEPKPI